MEPHEILDVDVALVDKAISLWRGGELVAIPTETVYGLAADATNGKAVARIYHVKSRPEFNPLIVHVADIEMAKRYVVWNDAAEALAKKFWPGPLTLVLPRRVDSPISELVSAGGDTLAIRVPSHTIALKLIRAFGGGLAAPSANRSGRVSPTSAAHVREEFGHDIPLVIDGGPCRVGLESTVVDVTGEHAVILRPGLVTQEMLDEALSSITNADAGSVDTSRSEPLPPEGGVGGGLNLGNSVSKLSPHPTLPLRGRASRASRSVTATAVLKSPGQLASHYAPSIPVRLNATDVAEDEALLAFGPNPLLGAATTLNLSERADLLEAAANLFAYLRALDNGYHRAIAVMEIPSTGVGVAINDRLTRAAA